MPVLLLHDSDQGGALRTVHVRTASARTGSARGSRGVGRCPSYRGSVAMAGLFIRLATSGAELHFIQNGNSQQFLQAYF